MTNTSSPRAMPRLNVFWPGPIETCQIVISFGLSLSVILFRQPRHGFYRSL